jgi:hypothetical protein
VDPARTRPRLDDQAVPPEPPDYGYGRRLIGLVVMLVAGVLFFMLLAWHHPVIFIGSLLAWTAWWWCVGRDRRPPAP